MTDRDAKTGQFLEGNRGGGRQKGSRNKLGQAFLTDLQEDWETHGKMVIQTVRAEKPDQYLKVVASILPKELNVNVNEFDELTDDELIARIRQLDATIRPFLESEGNGASCEGADEATTH